MRNIEIQRQNSDFEQELWRFYFIEGKIYLDSYYLLTRPTKRHKFKTTKLYNRISGRDNTISESEVPLTEEMKKEVLDKYISEIEVLKWSERNK